MRKQTNRTAYCVALFLFLGGIAYLAWSGFSEGRMPFINVAELKAAPEGEIKRAKIFGTVAGNGLKRYDDGLGAYFQLLDNDDHSISLWVDYKGALPDLFEEGAEVIVEGTLVEAQTFKASSLSTKCPSKYEKANRES